MREKECSQTAKKQKERELNAFIMPFVIPGRYQRNRERGNFSVLVDRFKAKKTHICDAL